MSTVLIIHYHLRPSGVTRVIASQVRALRNLGYRVVVASASPAPDEIPGVEYLVQPDLDYSKTSSIDFEALSKVKADLWMIHNPTLGLNQGYPEMIRRAVRLGQKILLQCHDFAEDGRPANYQLFADDEKIYPIADHIHYATINRRDHQFVSRAGIPTDQLHYLPNAVAPPVGPIGNSNPIQPGLIFYPARGIRRKNLGEICLLAAHSPPGVEFAIALNAGEAEPPDIHDDWRRFAESSNLPIQFEVSKSGPQEFRSWFDRASHFITTAVAEGFGLTFLEPVLAGKPLIGRDLPEITRDFSNKPLGQLYEKINIPAALLPDLKQRYQATLSKTFESYGLGLSQDEIDSAWEEYSMNGEVDFANLPEDLQQQIILDHPLPDLRDWLEKAMESGPIENVSLESWSPDQYTNQLEALLQKIMLSEASKSIDWLPKSHLLGQFLSPARFHFLRSS